MDGCRYRIDHVLLRRIGREEWEGHGARRKTALGGRRRWEEDGYGKTALGGQKVDEEDSEVGDKDNVVMTMTMRQETTRMTREMVTDVERGKVLGNGLGNGKR
jgi:hypothetical protein